MTILVSRHFLFSEMKCSHCGEFDFTPAFMEELDQLREEYGGPIIVNSGYRCPEHPIERIKVNGPGSHSYGAADLRVFGADAVRLLGIALRRGWKGVGVNQRLGTGVTSRYLHLDRMDSRAHAPRPSIWSY